MILTCPQCSANFKVPDGALGDNGRKVKCSDCGHIWHQVPETGDVLAAEEAPAQEKDVVDVDVPEDQGQSEQQPELQPEQAPEQQPEQQPGEDIPDAVKPQAEPEEESVPAEPKEPLKDDVKSRALGYAVAAVIFLATFTPLLFMADGMVKKWVGWLPFYDFFGIETPALGDGLDFDRLYVKWNNEFDMEVKGFVINLTNKEQDVPVIEALLKDSKGKSLGGWYIRLPQDRLEAENSLAFYSRYTGPNGNAAKVDLRFVAGVDKDGMLDGEAFKINENIKIDAANDGDSHAPQQGGSGHQSDHAAPEEAHTSHGSHH